MTAFSHPSALTRRLSCLVVMLLAACQSAPSRFYLLNSKAGPQSDAAATVASSVLHRAQYGLPLGPARSAGAPAVGVAVSVPEYLDRLDIVQRSGANELRPVDDAQWGESLSVAATRVLAENLTALLPSFDIIMLPARTHRQLDYEVDVDLTRFESDLAGSSVAAGRWSVTDAAGREIAGGHLSRRDQAGGAGCQAMAAAMSRNLMGLSGDIAAAVEAVSRRKESAPPSRVTRGDPRQ